MDFEKLLEIVGDDPIFESSLLLSGRMNPNTVRLQLDRWVKTGRIFKLRRGLYAVAPPYQKVKPHPFLVANRLQRASYVSLQTALAFYGFIPEIVHSIQNITAGRPERIQTPLGEYEYRHVKPELLRGYKMVDLGNRQQALVAVPEKALLDLVYLQPGGDASNYLQELRLQNLEKLDLERLKSQAVFFNLPKISRAVDKLIQLAQTESEEYQSL